jgi:hypothetical protein
LIRLAEVTAVAPELPDPSVDFLADGRYWPRRDQAGTLLPHFILFALIGIA